MSQDIIEKAKRLKEKHREKVGAELRDRVARETKYTLNYIERQRMRGKIDREIMKDLDNYTKGQQKNYD